MATETAEVEEDSSKEVSGKEKVAWDPFVSSDWDNQKPSSEAIVRIKRCNINHLCSILKQAVFIMLNCLFRDLHNLFTDPPPGIFVAPVADDITKVIYTRMHNTICRFDFIITCINFYFINAVWEKAINKRCIYFHMYNE